MDGHAKCHRAIMSAGIIGKGFAGAATPLLRVTGEVFGLDLLLAFGIFMLCVVGCMAVGASLAWALAAGFLCFFAVGLHRGNAPGALLKMAADGMKTSLRVLRILLLIGLLAALWRAGGTVAFFVRVGVALITPRTFILIAFLLPAVFCMAFGSSFGVVGTAGVILMTIARSGGADLVITAGAVMSGIYVGERLSPASSAAALTAAVSGVDQRDFQNRMWRDTPVPFLAALALYAALSWRFPILQVDPQVTSALESGFRLTWPTLLPAVALLALPWFKVSAVTSIAVSCVLSALCAVAIQGMSVGEVLYTCVMGYHAQQPELSALMSGGGLISMANTVIIVVLSCSYSGLFSGAGLLRLVTAQAGRLIDRIGLFSTHVVVSLVSCALFCNQTVGIVISAQVMEKEYGRRGLSPMELSVNIGNSTVNLAGLVPWAIAASVPLTAMGVGPQALLVSFYLYLLPLWCWVKATRGEKFTVRS